MISLISRYRNLIFAVLGALALFAVLGVLLAGRGGKTSSAPVPVTIQLVWKHGSNFAGYYAADKNGDYAKAGVSAELAPGGPGIDPVTVVLDGGAQFALTNAIHLLNARARGAPVKAIACVFQQSPLVFASRKGSGIKHPRDFAGKTVRVSGLNRLILRAMTGRFGLGAADYRIVETADRSGFLAGDIDVWGGYVNGRSHWILEKSTQFNVIHPDNYGIHAYYQCLVTTDRLIDGDPGLIAAVLRATLKGWRDMSENPDAAGPLTLAYDPDLDERVQTRRIKSVRPLFLGEQGRIGWMRPELWAQMVEFLRELGALDAPLDPSVLYDMRFLEKAHESGT